MLGISTFGITVAMSLFQKGKTAQKHGVFIIQFS
jgi:hypothetical protein